MTGFQKAENWLWMWKRRDLGWLKAFQEGCLSLLGCKPQVHLTAFRSPNDPAHSMAHSTLPTAPDTTAGPGTWCLPQRGFRIPSPIPHNPAHGLCQARSTWELILRRCWSQGLELSQLSPSCPVLDGGVRLWLAGPQRLLTAPTPETFHPLKPSDRNIFAWCLTAQWRHGFCCPPRPDFIPVHENRTFLGLVLTDVTGVEGMIVWSTFTQKQLKEGWSPEMGFSRCAKEESNLQQGL